jgi:hypothetical protein
MAHSSGVEVTSTNVMTVNNLERRGKIDNLDYPSKIKKKPTKIQTPN